ncbi:alpha/beta hydrolase [Peribacillus saganii]|uniref:Alpha/beta hydrolase n=1 Tax=Peribacillus saganii TaxID=2303992 RepID=A0A372LAH4_9BACI|nr:alpha/beta hydrolase [Peribacillus saganii]RFU62299.1 alpha/beta hydrolase [Peribacillus saganii]
MKKLLIFMLGILTYIIGIGMYFTNRVMYMKKKEERLIHKREISAKRLNLEEYESLPKKELTVPSKFGYDLHCEFVEPHTTNKWVIICHGVTENRFNSVKYMNLFLKRGFNAVIYDHRRHGKSGGTHSSYGYYEKFDLQAVIDELKKQKGSDIILGIHGESMGAATALLYGGMVEDGASFYIADCPFSNFRGQLIHRLKAEVPVLPSWMVLPIADRFLKLRAGWRIDDVAPIRFIKNIKSPVLFIHSQDDDFIPAEMTSRLFEEKEGPKKLYIAAKGAHAQSYNENPREYEKVIDEFLEELVLPAH